MAERRMFSKTIIDSDMFLDMPLSAQALYFHLSMRADDDGFLNNAQKIIRMTNASKNDFDLLLIKSFIIKFEDGVCVIKHWRIHNYIRSDRYKPTIYQDKIKKLKFEENRSYVLCDKVFDNGIPYVHQVDTQNSLGEDKLDKKSKGKISIKGDISIDEEVKSINCSLNKDKNEILQKDRGEKINNNRGEILKENRKDIFNEYIKDISNKDKIEIINNEEVREKTSIKGEADNDKIKEVINKWNSMNVQRIVSIKNRRLKLLNDRLNENGIERFLEALEKINNSRFLKGENNRGWVISFDWFINADNFLKVLEGTYDTNPEYNGQVTTYNKFNNFKPREYDYESLERRLLGWE